MKTKPGNSDRGTAFWSAAIRRRADRFQSRDLPPSGGGVRGEAWALPTSYGFTLIELLVVVSIIAVLLAMLTPALDRAIAQTEALTCAARKHVVSIGTLMYLQDNKRVFFTDAVRSDPTRIAEGAYDYNNDRDGEWYDLVRPYVTPGHGPMPRKVQYSDAFFCATIEQTISRAKNPAFRRMMADMAINAFLTGHTDTGFRPGPIRSTSVEPPMRVLLYVESARSGNPAWTMGDYAYVFNGPGSGPTGSYNDVLKVHEGASNMTFVDGHVVVRADPYDVGFESDLSVSRRKPYQLMHRPDTDTTGK